MRALKNRPRAAGFGVLSSSHAPDGFSMIELLVTIVLAGIIFGAMVPFFANALKRTSGDNVRVTENNIAQDRIEQVRLLGYSDITEPNLNYSPSPSASPFGDGRFGPSYYVAGSNRPYTILYTVVPQTNAQKVTVQVTDPRSGFKTSMQTIVKDPAAGTLLSTTGGTPTPLPSISGLTITVSFKDWSAVTRSGHYVTVTRVNTSVTPNVTFTPLPIKQTPSASNTTLTWADSPLGNLTGGTSYTYKLTCVGANATSNTPTFHLLQNARLKFDTNPGE
jgi:prepilin-type N-terminal cleavage/methylation domain-containing protein